MVSAAEALTELGAWVDRFGANQLGGSLYSVAEGDRLRRAEELVRNGVWVHLDAIIDASGASIGIDLDLIRDLRFRHPSARLDVHIIADTDAHVRAVLDGLRDACPQRLTVRGASIHAARDRFRYPDEASPEIWASLDPSASIGDVHEYLQEVDGILVMLIQPGTREQADLTLVDRVRALAPLTQVGVDGGVTSAVATVCFTAGAHYAVSGRAMLM